MAKRKPSSKDPGYLAGLTTGAKLEEFAEDLGTLLGTAQSKAQGWLSQRQAIVKHLEGVRDTATDLLNQLGARAARGYRAAANVNGASRRRTMSAAAREKIAAAQRRRWAKYRRAKAGK
jgi:hypothetical protein